MEILRIETLSDFFDFAVEKSHKVVIKGLVT
jgi:hypothetical protein